FPVTLPAAWGNGAGTAMSAVSFSPAGGAAGLCHDTPLSITFDQEPRVGSSGAIEVRRADGALADRIDLADPGSFRRFIGGAATAFNYFPLLVTGHTVAIYLHQALEYGQTYYVTIEPGVITDADGNPWAGIADPDTWRFSTRPAPP